MKMNSKKLQIFVISTVLLSSLAFASFESGFAFEWTKSFEEDFKFRNVTDITPTGDPTIKLIDDEIPGKIVVEVTDIIPNADLDNPDFACAKVDGSSLTLLETGDDTDIFKGNFTTGPLLVEYSRDFCNPTGEGTDESVEEDTWGQAARSSIDLDILSGNIKTSDFLWNSTNSRGVDLCFSPVIHAIDVQPLEGTTFGTESSTIILSWANIRDLEPGEKLSDLAMWYQDKGEGSWKRISPTFSEELILHPDGPFGFDATTKTIISNPAESPFSGQVTWGKFTIGSDTGCSGGGGGGLVRPSLVVNALAGVGGAGGGSAYSSPALQISNQVLLDWNSCNCI
jgi:hypothetical protein